MISVLLATVITADQALPFEPVSAWYGGKQYSVAAERISEGRFRLKAGVRTFDLYVREDAGRKSVILRPPQEVMLSFRIKGKARAARTVPPESDRVLQLAVGDAVSSTCDTLLFDDAKRAVQFEGPLYTLYSGADSGAIKVEFTKWTDTLKVAEVPYPEFSPPSYPAWTMHENPEWLAVIRHLYDSMSAPGRDATLDQSLKTPEMLQAWAVISAAYGRRLPANSLPNLTPDLKQLLERLTGAESIRILDLYPRSEPPEITVCHVRDGAIEYSFAVFINPSKKYRTALASFADLGLNPLGVYALFDVLSVRHLGIAGGAFALHVPPEGVRSVLIRKPADAPYILATEAVLGAGGSSTMGATWNAAKRELSGTVKNRTRSVDIYIARSASQREWTSPTGTVDGSAVEVFQNRGFWRLTVKPTGQGRTSWHVRFAESRPEQTAELVRVAFTPGSPTAVVFERQQDPTLRTAGCYLFRNGALVAYTADSFLLDGDVEPNVTYTYTITPTTYGHSVAQASSALVTTPKCADTFLHAIDPLSWKPFFSPPSVSRSGAGRTIVVGGKPSPGLGMVQESEATYRFSLGYEQLEGAVALDDASDADSKANFTVFGDGIELWSSGEVRKGTPRPFSLDVSKVRMLTVRVEGTHGAMPVVLTPKLVAKPSR